MKPALTMLAARRQAIRSLRFPKACKSKPKVSATRVLLTNREKVKLKTKKTIARAQVDLQRQVWKEAALHEHGGGLETGIPSLQAARNAIRYLRRHGFFAQARALEYILVGFFQDPDDNTPLQLAICPRCALGKRATRYHTAYECSDNLEIKDEISLN